MKLSQRSHLQARSGKFIRYCLLTFMASAALVPLYLMLAGAFKTQEQFLSSPFGIPLKLNFGGFKAAWTDQFPSWFLNSFLIVTGAVVLTEILAAFAAWGFARYSFKGRETILGIAISLMVIPPVVLLLPLFQFGVRLGMISTLKLIVIIYVGLMLPFSIYMLTNYFRTIPVSILESANVDGASSMRVFRSIVVPISGAPLATLAVVNLLWAWNELLLALVFLQDNEKKTLMVGITGFQSRYSLSIPTIMAGMVLATLPLLVAYLFAQRYFVAGLTAGSVKGE